MKDPDDAYVVSMCLPELRDRLEASFDDGTLTLRIHRIEARPRSVAIR